MLKIQIVIDYKNGVHMVFHKRKKSFTQKKQRTGIHWVFEDCKRS